MYGDQIYLTKDDYLGMTLTAFLQRKIQRDRTITQIKRKTDVLDDQIILYLPFSWAKDYHFGTEITNEQVIAVNKLIEERFEEDLFRFCYMFYMTGFKKKQAIEEFCIHYNLDIDTDVTYENLKKMEYRYRIKLEQKQSPLILSPKKRGNPRFIDIFSSGSVPKKM